MGEHTPGPWTAKNSRIGNILPSRWNIWQTVGRKTIRIASVDAHPTAEANACLIAAAPTLLGALKGLVKWDRTKSTSPINKIKLWGEIISDAKAAIAKAKR